MPSGSIPMPNMENILICASYIMIITLLAEPVGSSVSLYKDCVPRNCSTGPKISYPFYILGIQHEYCGMKGFEIRCEGERPIYRTSQAHYIVREISYKERSFRLVNDAVLDDTCPVPMKNFSFDLSSLRFGEDGLRDLCFYYYCDPSPPVNGSAAIQIDCQATDRRNQSLVGLARSRRCDQDSNWNMKACRSFVAAPVQLQKKQLNLSIKELGYNKLLDNGFTLKWNKGGCAMCREAGGRCGSANGTSLCYCSDGTYGKLCKDGKNDTSLKIGLGSGIGTLSIIVILMAIFMMRYRRMHPSSKVLLKNNSAESSLMSELAGSHVYFEVRIFQNKELEEATNNFHTSQELGDGGFGTVYYGKLRDGREVAVKRLYENNYRRVKQFMTEVQILTRLHHKNLVSLYGCTSRQSRELLLVYEYVPNGTVADHLHGDRNKEGPLPWHIRMSIAVETATALAYLHASDIIHRDVKTNNILLDNNFCVEVGDFGLSRLFPTDVTHVSTAPQGTPGYVDPEYHQCYQLTEKSDVYSFGVVLVELLSSLPAVDISRDRHEINLANLAINRIQKRAFHQLIDPRLGFDSDVGIREMITGATELAFMCLQQEKEMRPSMVTVLEQLNAIAGGRKAADESKRFSPSPEADEAVLLRKTNFPSPISVTQKWVSSGSSCTPSTSA